MTDEDLRQHLRDHHGFGARGGDPAFLAGVHHGLHVEAGRSGAENHWHELRRAAPRTSPAA